MARSRPNSSFSLRAFSVRKNGSKGSQLPCCLSLFSRMSTNYRDCKVIRFFSENFWTSSVLVRQFLQAIFWANRTTTDRSVLYLSDLLSHKKIGQLRYNPCMVLRRKAVNLRSTSVVNLTLDLTGFLKTGQ